MIPNMDRLARAHTAHDTIELLESQDKLRPLLPHMWPPNSPDLNPVDYCIWGELERRVYRGRTITTVDELKEALTAEWKKFPQETINSSIDSFTKRLQRAVEMEGSHVESY